MGCIKAYYVNHFWNLERFSIDFFVKSTVPRSKAFHKSISQSQCSVKFKEFHYSYNFSCKFCRMSDVNAFAIMTDLTPSWFHFFFTNEFLVKNSCLHFHRIIESQIDFCSLIRIDIRHKFSNFHLGGLIFSWLLSWLFWPPFSFSWINKSRLSLWTGKSIFFRKVEATIWISLSWQSSLSFVQFLVYLGL